MKRIAIIDSHTGGEPTRVIVSGGPDLGSGTVVERLALLREEFDAYRTATVCEPRGNDIIVGALLVEPSVAGCATGVIFFNNVGYLGMCGHGTIGLVATLAYQGRISPGEISIETPVGVVKALLQSDGCVSVRNVPSYRLAKGITLDVPGYGTVTGDVSYGGNTFFLVAQDSHSFALTYEEIEAMTAFCWAVRRAANVAFPAIDHVELFGKPMSTSNHSRNFVLCPGGAYDRSPCGTGTSAKLACLYADGKLAPGEVWLQESITGSVFEGTVKVGEGGAVLPTITGRAYVNGEATLLLDPDDPLCWGL